MIGQACQQVGRPILFAISIIVIVFLPLFTLQGVEGKTFRPLAYTVALAMFGSLIFALLLAPVLSYFFLSRSTEKDGTDNFGDRMLTRLTSSYRPLVTRFVCNRRLAVIVSAGLLVFGIGIFPQLGSEFTPELQEGTIVARLTMAPSPCFYATMSSPDEIPVRQY